MFVVRRGKRRIIGMEGGATEQDMDNEPKIEEEFDKFFDMPTSVHKEG